jgi:hypothetical protein
LTRIDSQVNGQAASAERSVSFADPKGKPADDPAVQADDGSFHQVLTKVATKEVRHEDKALKPPAGSRDAKGRPVDGVGLQPAAASFHRLLTRVAEIKPGLEGESHRGQAPSTTDGQVEDDNALPDVIEGLADAAPPDTNRSDPLGDPGGEANLRDNNRGASPLPDVSSAPIPFASVALRGDARFFGAALVEKKVQGPITGLQNASLSADWSQQDLAGGISVADDVAPLFTQAVAAQDAPGDSTIVMKVTAAVLDQQTHLPPVAPAPIDQIVSRIMVEADGSEPVEQNSGLGSSNDRLMAGNAMESLPGTFSAVKILSLRLEPAHLGAVTLRLRLSGANLGVEVEAEQADTADLLSKDSAALVEKLQASGYSLEQLVIRSAPRPFLLPGSDGAHSGEPFGQGGLLDRDGALPINAQVGEQDGNGRRQSRSHASPPEETVVTPDAPAAPHLHGARFV